MAPEMNEPSTGVAVLGSNEKAQAESVGWNSSTADAGVIADLGALAALANERVWVTSAVTKAPTNPANGHPLSPKNTAAAVEFMTASVATLMHAGCDGVSLLVNAIREVRERQGLPHVLVGDLDHVVADGAIAPPALEWLRSIQPSYCALSPSGAGVRFAGLGDLDRNYNMRDVFGEGTGLELYSGHVAQHARVALGKLIDLGGGIPDRLEPLEMGPVLEVVAQHGAKSKSAPKRPLPEAVDVPEDWVDRVPPATADRIAGSYDGAGDRSAMVLYDTCRLLEAGLTDAEALAVLEDGSGSWAVAEAHRRGRREPARQWLWGLVLDARAKVGPPLEFDDLGALPADEARPKPARRPGFTLTPIGQVLQHLGPPEWQVEGITTTDSLVLIFGAPLSYKSFISVDMAACTATGTPWQGRPVRRGPVVYVAGEGQQGIGRRFAAWGHHHGVDLSTVPLYVSSAPAGLSDRAAAEAVKATVDGVAAEHGAPAMIVVDTVARNFGPGDENSTSDMGRFVAHLDTYLRVPYRACVVLVHHSGHRDGDRARGSIALSAATDAEYRVERGDGPLACTMSCTRQKDAPMVEPIYLRGQVVTVDLDRGLDSLVFRATDAPAIGRATRRRGLGDTQLALLAVLDDLSFGGAEGIALEDWREEAIRRQVVDGDRAGTKFAQAMERMRAREPAVLTVDGGRIWPL